MRDCPISGSVKGKASIRIVPKAEASSSTCGQVDRTRGQGAESPGGPSSISDGMSVLGSAWGIETRRQPCKHLPRGDQHPGLRHGQPLQVGPIQGRQGHPSGLAVGSRGAGRRARSRPCRRAGGLSLDWLGRGGLHGASDGAHAVQELGSRSWRWLGQLDRSGWRHVLTHCRSLRGPGRLDAHHQDALRARAGRARWGGS